jgi:hypothetical protein
LIESHAEILGSAAGEFHDLDFTEVNFSAFGFEAEVAFAEVGFADAVHEFSVDGEFDGAIDGDDDVLVPLALPFAAHFVGHAAAAAWVFGDRFHAAGPEEFAADVAHVVGGTVALLVDVGPLEFEHLDFHSEGETVAGWFGIAPEEDAGVASGFHVSPFDDEDEVFILLGGAHDADGVAGANEEAVFDGPGFGRGVDVDPVGEVLAVEEVGEAEVGGGGSWGFFLGGEGGDEDEGWEEFFEEHL